MRVQFRLAFSLSMALFFLQLGSVYAQDRPAAGQQPATAMPSMIKVPPEAEASPNFNAETATNAYLAEMPAESRAKSDAYFEGGYWLLLWDFLYVVAVSLILLELRWSAKMRDWSERITRFKPVHTFVYWVQYLVLTTILFFPITVYEGFTREWKYGLATQTFGAWMGDQAKGLGVGLVQGGILVVTLLGMARKATSNWWVWGA